MVEVLKEEGGAGGEGKGGGVACCETLFLRGGGVLTLQRARRSQACRLLLPVRNFIHKDLPF